LTVPTDPNAITKLLAMKSVLGLRIAGDLAGWTWYTTKRGKVVAYPQAPPTKPPSPLQVIQRQRFKAAREAWLRQTAAVRANWNLLCDRLGICMTGINLYISLALVPNPKGLQIAIAKTGITVTHPTEIPK
jgi:hypothetical protein